MNYEQLKQLLQNNLLYGEQERRGEKTALAVSLVMPDVFKVWGGDFSHWNIPPVDMPRMVDIYQMSFAIIKGCDGSLNSKYYFEHVAKAKEAGIPWGMYVWIYPNSKVSIDAQVNAWHTRFIADPPPLGLFIDAEGTTYGGQPANPTASDLRMAHDKWFAKSGQEATTYTAKGYADTYLIGFDWSREKLWVANYNVSTPNLPKGASGWEFWQFASTLDGKALDPNGNAELDGNYYNGNKADFAAEWGTSTIPPTGEPMTYKLKVNAPAGLNGRGTLGGVIKDKYQFGDILTAENSQIYNGAVWHKIVAWESNGIPRTMSVVPEYASEGLPTDNYYPYLSRIEEPPPPAPVKITGIEINLVAGSTVTIKKSDGTTETITA